LEVLKVGGWLRVDHHNIDDDALLTPVSVGLQSLTEGLEALLSINQNEANRPIPRNAVRLLDV